jgi:basic amino acid/polyamine antiporter, APA family
MSLTVAITSAAIANGAVQYLMVLVGIDPAVLTSIVILSFTMIAVLGVRETVGLAALFGIVELGGLGVAIVLGFTVAPGLHIEGMMPSGLAGWSGVAGGAFIAFFAFLGFENLANMSEEVKDASRTVPRAIIVAIGASIVLYVLVAAAITMADRTGSNPLLDLFESRSALIFAGFSAIAIANGVLVGIVTLSRLFYGMAKNGTLPSQIGRVSAMTRTPVLATLLAGGLVLVTAVAVPFEHLLVWTNALTLSLFIAVDLALWHLPRPGGAATIGFRVPRFVPVVAAALSLSLLAAEMLS